MRGFDSLQVYALRRIGRFSRSFYEKVFRWDIFFHIRKDKEDENLDNFREWLSDNLRYIMLGGAVLLIVLVLFFGVRACVGKKKTNRAAISRLSQISRMRIPILSPMTARLRTAKEDDNPLVKDNGEIKELMKQYYTALGSKDVAALKTITEGLTPTEEARITNAQYIEGYELSEVYTKKRI